MPERKLVYFPTMPPQMEIVGAVFLLCNFVQVPDVIPAHYFPIRIK